MSNDISSLFGKTTGIAGSISDYNSIKNGSYGKLMKSYYGNAKVSGTANGTGRTGKNTTLDKLLSERKNPTFSKEALQANSKLAASVKGLTSALSALQSKNTYNKNAKGNNANTAADAKKSLKDFISSYNDAVTSSKKSTRSNISKNIKGIMDAVRENKSALKELGINENKDGTLGIDEKKLQAADTDKIRDLFDGDKAMSLGSKAASRLNRASYYVNEENAATAKDDAAKEATTANSGSLMESITGLKDKDAFAVTTDEEGNEQYDVNAITSQAEDFIKNYNSTIGSARNSADTNVTSNLSSMLQKTAQDSGDLAEIGITVGNDGRLSMDRNTFRNSDMSKVRETLSQFATDIEADARRLNYFSGTDNETNAATGYSADGGYLSAAEAVSQMYDDLL